MSAFIWRFGFRAPGQQPATASPGPSARPTASTSSEPPTEPAVENLIAPLQYSPSPTDVGLVRALLKTTQPALPTEIADIILDFADYSVKDVVTFDPSRVLVISSRGPAVYGLVLKGPQIRELKQDGLELRDLKIEAVRFEIASHDQGWGGEWGSEGTYNAAFSWFEVTILRRISHSCGKIEPPPNIGLEDSRKTPEDYSKAYRRSGWDFVTGDNGKILIWPLQKNKVAKRITQSREIVWILDGDGERQQARAKGDAGSGSGEGFVRALQPGDVICLWARAMYPGWANFVEKAVIEVAYSD